MRGGNNFKSFGPAWELWVLGGICVRSVRAEANSHGDPVIFSRAIHCGAWDEILVTGSPEFQTGAVLDPLRGPAGMRIGGE